MRLVSPQSALAFLLAAALFLALAAPAGADSYSTADLILDGSEYSNSGSSGKGWTNLTGGATYTAWKGWVEYEVYLTAGEWTFGLEVINRGYLGSDWYSSFKVQDSITNQVMSIAASDEVANVGTQTAEILSDGVYTIRFSWLNDQYSTAYNPVRDANIQINKVFFDKNTPSAGAPEPASGVLLASAMGFAAWLRRRDRRPPAG